MPVLFTSESAKFYAKMSHAPDSARNLKKLLPQNEADEAESFRLLRLSRVRREIVRIDRMLADELDPARLEKFARALASFNDQERLLAQRQSLKPISKPKSSNQVQEAPQPRHAGETTSDDSLDHSQPSPTSPVDI